MSIDPDEFKRALGSWATGVTIVTSQDGTDRQGMTVSAFNEVSLEPPLVLVCADKTTITNELIQTSRMFSVSILARDQDALSNKFASKKDEFRRFEGLDCVDGSTGCPRIPGAIAWLDCSLHETVDAGDHYLHIGCVQSCDTADRAPLLYFRSTYGELA